MRGAEAASDADWGPSSMACSRWQASARKKRRPEAISGIKSAPPRRPKPSAEGETGPPDSRTCWRLAARRSSEKCVCWKLAEARNHSASALEPHACLAHCPPPSDRCAHAAAAAATHVRNRPPGRHKWTGAWSSRDPPAGRLARAGGRKRTRPAVSRSHTHPRERRETRARATHRQKSQCFSP